MFFVNYIFFRSTSFFVDTAEKAMTILPLVLIPQIMLAGLIAKGNGFVEILSYLTILDGQ